ncbi:PIR Superfamily Protein [Plasmodium ovale wallikeri]|uniref:PIR Superfamily Protein n=1 Tax=Plasmodium ovale wallikeri TaxID=864142 RepID=A0A1A9ARC9_PLAOA|nr:PIR Superfamily Protein [Plasmodium ovale wallikeri]SBT58680.1 PIR Superfamily Protein [Plasmodium ovale wallikeri]
MTPQLTISSVNDYYKKIFYKYGSLKYAEKIINTGILECKDPILKNIAFLITENYGNARDAYNSSTDETNRKLYCIFLQGWIDYMKYFYTYGGKCEVKKKLWMKYINEPWQQIEKQFHDNSWCSIITEGFDNSFQPELVPDNCNDHGTISPIIPLSVCFSIFSFILICIILYKFTPMKSWIKGYIGMKKKSWQDINNEGKEELSENSLYNLNEHIQHDIDHIAYHLRRN